MGVDLYYCKECEECVHSDDFRSCLVCVENSDICVYCDSHLLLDFSNNKDQYVCEDCVIDYKNIKFEDKNNEINDFMRKKTISQDEIISVLKTKYDSEYSPEKRIVKMQDKIKEHKQQIKELNSNVKKLKKELSSKELLPFVEKSC